MPQSVALQSGRANHSASLICDGGRIAAMQGLIDILILLQLVVLKYYTGSTG